MNRYLRSIGFKDYKNRKRIELLIRDVVLMPDSKKFLEDGQGGYFVELRKNYGENMGIGVRGVYMDDEKFHMDYFFPYFNGDGITTTEPVEIERNTCKESYYGICDELRIGVTLIFFLQNMLECLENSDLETVTNPKMAINTTLSALSTEGKILLPIYKNESQIQTVEKHKKNRSQLVAAARKGDEDAMDSLTMEDIDTYSSVTKRVLVEDILTIVETYFMPYGFESDQYSILGEILNCRTTENELTKEKSYILTLNTNNVVFDVCINEEDLVGEPEVGRRFKGTIWLQGKVNFATE